MVLTTACAAQSLASMVGDVTETCRHEEELVQMPRPHPWAGQRTIKDKGKVVNTETNAGIAVNKSSLIYLEDWDLVDNNNGLAKLQHKLQQTVRREDRRLEIGCVGTRRSLMRHPS